jgi:hypothetical protein
LFVCEVGLKVDLVLNAAEKGSCDAGLLFQGRGVRPRGPAAPPDPPRCRAARPAGRAPTPKWRTPRGPGNPCWSCRVSGQGMGPREAWAPTAGAALSRACAWSLWGAASKAAALERRPRCVSTAPGRRVCRLLSVAQRRAARQPLVHRERRGRHVQRAADEPAGAVRGVGLSLELGLGSRGRAVGLRAPGPGASAPTQPASTHPETAPPPLLIHNPRHRPQAAAARQALALREPAHRRLLGAVLRDRPGAGWGSLSLKRGGFREVSGLPVRAPHFGAPCLTAALFRPPRGATSSTLQARFTKGHPAMKCYGLGLGLDTFRCAPGPRGFCSRAGPGAARLSALRARLAPEAICGLNPPRHPPPP